MAELTGTTADARETPPAEPPPSAQNQGSGFRKWRTRALVLLMIIAAVLIGMRIANSQAVRDAQLDLGNVTLTSQPIPIETSQPGLVTSVDVEAGQRVTAGQRVGTIEVTTTNSAGRPVVSQRVLTAPRAGVVVDDPLTLGSTLQPGVAFVELYDPARLTLVTDVPLSYLTEIAPGMSAKLEAQGLDGPIEAQVVRAVPRVGTGQSSVAPDHLEIVLVPRDPTTVGRLVPGLRFTGTVDTSTRPSGQPLVYVE